MAITAPVFVIFLSYLVRSWLWLF